MLTRGYGLVLVIQVCQKKSYDNSDAAISAAKLVNKHDPKETTKLVAYKCTHCYKYHLLTVNKKIK